MGLALLAGPGITREGDDGVVDGSEGTDERGIGNAQLHLGLCPGLIGGLGAQHLAHGVADRQQGADDLRRPGRDSRAAFAFPDGDRDRGAAGDLHQAAGLADEVGALLDGAAVGAGSGSDEGGVRLVLVRCGTGRRREDAGRQP